MRLLLSERSLHSSSSESSRRSAVLFSSESTGFAAVARIEVGAAVLQLALAVALALGTDLGVWVIVIGRLASGSIRTVLFSALAKLPPRLGVDWSIARTHLRFNLGTFANFLFSYGSKNADYVVVGRVLGAEQLGAYYVAFVIPNILRQRATWLSKDVVFPILSRRKEDSESIARAFLSILRTTTILTGPVLVGLAALAGPAVELMFGDQWGDAVGPLAILSIAAATEVVNQAGQVVLLSLGYPDRAAVLNAVRLVVILLGVPFVIGSNSLDAMALVVLGSTLGVTLASGVILYRLIEVGLRGIVNASLPSVAMSVAVFATGRAITTAMEAPPLVEVLVGSAIAGIAGLFVGLMFFRNPTSEAIGFVRRVVRRDPALRKSTE